MTLSELNALTHEEFVHIIGPVFERSPWVARMTWAGRPFESVEALNGALCETIADAGVDRQLALLRAHPDLGSGLSNLSAASAREQAQAGLDRLSPQQAQWLAANNDAYRSRFGFPFIVCARLSASELILTSLAARLTHSRDREVAIALKEVGRIALLRLQDVIRG
jgi:OHCU decarboxylase